MRILFWSDTFYPTIGGVEVLGADFVRALHARGHEVLIICGPYLEKSGPPETFYDIPLYRFPFEYSVHPYDAPMIARIKQRLAELREQFRPDVFHLFQSSRGFFFHLTGSNASANGQRPAPTILTLHSSYFRDTPQINQARRLMCLQVDWITACSRDLLDETRVIVPNITTKSSLIFNALPTPACEPSELNFEQPRILYVGRLHPIKRVDLAIDAFARIQGHFPKARLIIAGEGIEGERLRAQVEQLGLNAFVDFLGAVAPQAVPKLINSATIMVVPSTNEGFGLVALQGGQMARPVIGTRVGGLPEVIVDGETGILVESGNADALAAAITELLSDPERARAMGLAGRQYVQQRFGWTSFVEQYEALYTRLVEQAKTRA